MALEVGTHCGDCNENEVLRDIVQVLEVCSLDAVARNIPLPVCDSLWAAQGGGKRVRACTFWGAARARTRTRWPRSRSPAGCSASTCGRARTSGSAWGRRSRHPGGGLCRSRSDRDLRREPGASCDESRSCGNRPTSGLGGSA